jgi:hypothetical protein
MDSATTPHETIAVAFASALVAGDFDRAHAMLVPELRQRLTPEDLRGELQDMYSGYAKGPPKQTGQPTVQEDWPDKRPGDLGWVYVGIIGDDFVEAVSVTVANVNGQPLIREIEWGRP